MQSINLDIRTLSFVTTSIATFFACGLFAFGVLQKEFKGFPLLASAVALYAAGHLLLIYRDVLPDFVTIILANLMLITAIVFYYEGTRRFLDHATKFHPISIITIIIGILSFLYFTYWTPSVNNRIISITAIHVVISALCVLELRRDLHVSWRLPGLATAFVFTGYSLYQLSRLLWTLRENPIQSFMSAGTVQAFAFVSAIFLITGSTFGFIWMVSKKLEYDLTNLATHDPLTNVLNRRGIEFLASQEFTKLGRFETDLAIVMIDIDYFKNVNDRFGHSAGDVLLTAFAKLIQNCLRPYDIFGRIGGEEFLILLPNTKLDLALTLTERIRKQIEEHVFKIGTNEIQITASFGVSDYVPDNVTLDKLIPFADKALLQSKQQGRNQVSSSLHRVDEK